MISVNSQTKEITCYSGDTGTIVFYFSGDTTGLTAYFGVINPTTRASVVEKTASILSSKATISLSANDTTAMYNAMANNLTGSPVRAVLNYGLKVCDTIGNENTLLPELGSVVNMSVYPQYAEGSVNV